MRIEGAVGNSCRKSHTILVRIYSGTYTNIACVYLGSLQWSYVLQGHSA